MYVCMYVCCDVIPFILDVILVDAPAGVIQEEGHTDASSRGTCLNFLARRIQPFLFPVDHEVEFCVPTN